MCRRRGFAGSNGKQREVCPVDSIKERPSFDVRIHGSSSEKIDEETDGLQHQGSLTQGQIEALLVVILVGAVNGAKHQCSHNEINDCCEYGVVECLRESMIVPGLKNERPAGTGTKSNQRERRQVPGQLSELMNHSVEGDPTIL